MAEPRNFHGPRAGVKPTGFLLASWGARLAVPSGRARPSGGADGLGGAAHGSPLRLEGTRLLSDTQELPALLVGPRGPRGGRSCRGLRRGSWAVWMASEVTGRSPVHAEWGAAHGCRRQTFTPSSMPTLGAGEVITGAADAPGNVSAWGCLQSHRLQNCRQPLCSPAGHACQWPTLRSAFCVPPKYPPLPSLFKPQESVGSWARTAACLLHSVLTRRCPCTWRTSGSSSVGRPSFRTGLRPPACPPRYRSPGRKSQESFWPHAFLPVPFSFGFGSACFPVGSRRA